MFVYAINRMIANVVADVRDVRNFGLTLDIYPFGSIFFETPLIFLFLLCIFFPSCFQMKPQINTHVLDIFHMRFVERTSVLNIRLHFM